MVDIIAKHNAKFLGKNNNLLRIREVTTTTTTTQAFDDCVEYGLLYNWYAVTDARGIAPAGWHVPSIEEYTTLSDYLGGSSIAGQHLKEVNINYWNSILYNDNSSGFNLRASGFRNRSTGDFSGIKSYGTLWTATLLSGDFAYSVSASELDSVFYLYNYPTGIARVRTGQGVRLIKNDSINTGTMTDYDGNVYPTVTIGTQVWMTRNLVVQHYNNGDIIPQVTDNAAWAALTTGAMCAYNNTWSNVGCELDGYDVLAIFQTNSGSSTTFDPTISKNSGDFAWDLGDGTVIFDTLAISHTYADSSTKTVKLYGKNTPNITVVDFQSDNIVGTLDVSHSAFNTCVNYSVQSNSGLTKLIVAAAPTATLDYVNISLCNITGVLDLSSYTKLNATNASFNLDRNYNMTGVLFANSFSSGKLGTLNVSNCNITGALNLSMFSALSTNGIITAYSNPLLTSVTFAPSITGTLASVQVYYCNITGAVDLSMFSALSSNCSINFSSNPLLTSVTFTSGTVTGSIYQMSFNNCNLSTIDLSKFTSYINTYSQIALYYNVNLTTITFASSITGVVNYISAHHCNLTGNLDLSKITNIYTDAQILLNHNPLLTSVTLSPTTITGTLKQLNLSYCNLTGSLDLSKVGGYSTSFSLYLNNNPNMTGVTFAAAPTAGTMSQMYLHECNLTGTVDLSMFTAMVGSSGAYYYLYTNPNLTGVILPSTITGTLNTFNANTTALTGTLDLSMFKTLSSAASITLNPAANLTGLTFSGTSIAGKLYNFSIISTALSYIDLTKLAVNYSSITWGISGALSAADINRMLVEVDTNASAGYTARYLYWSGNAAPDNSSGGYDGLAAKASLIAKGFTVQTN